MEGAHYTHFEPMGKQKREFLLVAVGAQFRYNATAKIPSGESHSDSFYDRFCSSAGRARW